MLGSLRSSTRFSARPQRAPGTPAVDTSSFPVPDRTSCLRVPQRAELVKRDGAEGLKPLKRVNASYSTAEARGVYGVSSKAACLASLPVPPHHRGHKASAVPGTSPQVHVDHDRHDQA